MKIIQKSIAAVRYDTWLTAMLIVTAMLLLTGITYGLPLHLVGDEESLIGGALKMLELRQFIPALNPAAFDALYYPVILPYVIHIFSLPVIFVTFASAMFSITALQDSLMRDLDGIWLSARMISFFGAIGTVLVIYGIAREWHSRRVALIAASLVSVSFFMINLGHWMRHWSLVTFLVYVTLYCVIRYIHGKSAAWYLASVTGALAVGVSYVAALGNLCIGLYAILHKKTLGSRYVRYLAGNALLFVILVSASIALYYQDFFHQLTAEHDGYARTMYLTDVLATLGRAALAYVFQEPIIGIGAFLALVFVSRSRKESASIFGAVIGYCIVLHFFFHFEPRYIHITIPLMAVSAALFFDWLCDILGTHRGLFVYGMCIAYVMSSIIRYDWLLLQKDTRILAREWMLGALGSEMILSSPQIIAPRTTDSLAREIGLGSIRAHERYQLKHRDRLPDPSGAVSYTNVHFWNNKTTDDLVSYLEIHRPRYAVIDRTFEPAIDPLTQELTVRGKLLLSFRQSNGRDEAYDINGNFFAPSFVVFSLERLGPRIDIYELSYPDILAKKEPSVARQ